MHRCTSFYILLHTVTSILTNINEGDNAACKRMNMQGSILRVSNLRKKDSTESWITNCNAFDDDLPAVSEMLGANHWKTKACRPPTAWLNGAGQRPFTYSKLLLDLRGNLPLASWWPTTVSYTTLFKLSCLGWRSARYQSPFFGWGNGIFQLTGWRNASMNHLEELMGYIFWGRLPEKSAQTRFSSSTSKPSRSFI